MISGIDAFYQRLADSMLDAIPEEWSTASYQVIFFSDCSVYEAEYTRKTDGVAKSFQPATSGDQAFRELRQRFKDAGKPLWGRACFELRADGTFNMKWDYDNCDQEGNAIYDEDAERRRHDARIKRLSRFK